MVGAVDTQLVKRSCKGFTLVEILLVLILIALLSTVVQSSFGKLKVTDGAIERERLMMIARIVHARNEALLLNKDRELKITQDGTAVQYTKLTPLPEYGYSDTANAVVTLQDNVQIAQSDGDSDSTSDMSLKFSKDGTYDGPSMLTFKIKDDDASDVTTITINGIGYVQ